MIALVVTGAVTFMAGAKTAKRTEAEIEKIATRAYVLHAADHGLYVIEGRTRIAALEKWLVRIERKLDLLISRGEQNAN